MPQISDEEYQELLVSKVINKSLKYLLGIITFVSASLLFFGYDIKKKAESAITKADSLQNNTKNAQQNFSAFKNNAEIELRNIEKLNKIQQEQFLSFSMLPSQYSNATLNFIEQLQSLQYKGMDSLFKWQNRTENISKKAIASLDTIKIQTKTFSDLIEEQKGISKEYERKFDKQSINNNLQIENFKKEIDELKSYEVFNFRMEANEIVYSKVLDAFIEVNFASFKPYKIELHIKKGNKPINTIIVGERQKEMKLYNYAVKLLEINDHTVYNEEVRVYAAVEIKKIR